MASKPYNNGRTTNKTASQINGAAIPKNQKNTHKRTRRHTGQKNHKKRCSAELDKQTPSAKNRK